jgi:hypothetical protein
MAVKKVGSGPEAETLQKGLYLLLRITAAGLRFRARSGSGSHSPSLKNDLVKLGAFVPWW